MKRILANVFLLLAATRLAAAGADEKLWDHGLRLPAELIQSWGDRRGEQMVRSPNAHILVWTPPGTERVKAVLLIANNTDLVKIGEHARVREVAAQHGMAILYLRNFSGRVVEGREPHENAAEHFEAVLALAEKTSGTPGFREAPWITLGKSSRGKFAFQPAWAFPERVVATISYHGETPPWPPPAWAAPSAAASNLHLNVQGLTEWDGTWYRHVRPSLLNYNRHSNWLAHQVVVYGVDHGYYADYFLFPNFGQEMPRDHRLIRVTDVWDYLAEFMDTALHLRLPGPDAEDQTLRAVDRSQGYLLHPRIVEELLGSKWFALRQNEDRVFQIIPWPDERSPVFDENQGTIPLSELVRPARDLPEDERGAWFWVANRNQLRAWLRLHNAYRLADRVLETLPPTP